MSSLTPKELLFYGEIVLGAFIVVGFLKALNQRGISDDSNFRSRESDQKYKMPTSHTLKHNSSQDKKRGALNDLAHAKMKVRTQVLQLTGMRLDVPPHELLGISRFSNRATIQKAYKELMKQYHPDALASMGIDSKSSQWKDVQKIAEAINLAREEMLKSCKDE